MLRRALVVLCLTAVPLTASAGTWRYSLKPGTTAKFHYSGTDDVSMQLPMMGPVTQHLVVDTDYTLKVVKALPDGRADVELTLEKVSLTDGAGKATTLGKLPKDMQVLRAFMTPRGHFEFYKKVVVEVADDGHYALGFIDAKKGSASASAAVGGEEVTATAAIDPKTGKVSAAITRKAVAPTTHTEERTEPAQVDVLPAQVLSLMELPEGPVVEGQPFRVDLPSMKFEGQGLPGEACGKATCSKLSMKSLVDGSPQAMTKTAGAVGAPAEEQAAMDQEMKHADQEMAAGMADMQAQMGGMMGMGAMPGMGGAATGGGLPTMTQALDATMLFDEKAGRLQQVAGTVSMNTSMSGVKMTTQSAFTLKAR